MREAAVVGWYAKEWLRHDDDDDDDEGWALEGARAQAGSEVRRCSTLSDEGERVAVLYG